VEGCFPVLAKDKSLLDVNRKVRRIVWLNHVQVWRNSSLSSSSYLAAFPTSCHRNANISYRDNTRLFPTPVRIHSLWGLPWTVVKRAFAGIRNRYTELMPAPVRGSIQTQKKTERRMRATDGFERFVDV
jgi:hypothetical protein